MHAPESERDELFVDHVYDMIVVSNRRLTRTYASHHSRWNDGGAITSW